MQLFCYYPLKDRLTADLFRDWLVTHCPDSSIGPLVDHLTDNHPLPHFSAQLSDKDAQTANTQLTTVSTTLSIRISGPPDYWLGRTLVMR